MISRAEMASYLNLDPSFDDMTCGLRAIQNHPSAVVKDARKVIALGRKFNAEVVKPYVRELDMKMSTDPDHLPYEFVKKANEWGLYTLFIPKIFGGKGYDFSCLTYLLEEIGSTCLAMGNLVGVHYLGYTMLVSSWNIRVIHRISKYVVEGERSKKPCLLSLAMTEPNAGTDSQNTEFMDTGNLRCHAKKVEGGYVLNGTKIFISCGHLSTWHIVHAYTDLDRASENTVMIAVKTGTDGFSFGKKEKKMGQKGSIASELIFNDCFVPDKNICIDTAQAKKLSRPVEETNAQIFAYIWGASRVGVGCFGASAARNAFEEALKFATKHRVEGKALVEHEWCQCLLAEMYANAAMARTVYMEGIHANAQHGLWKILSVKPLYYTNRWLPGSLLHAIFNKLAHRPFITNLFRKICLDHQKDEEIDRVDGWGSIAKIAGTDAAMRNCQMALDIMGEAGVRHDMGVEKILRDAKLLQIYEGTNQVNRVNIFKRLIAKQHLRECAFSMSTL